MTDLGKAYATAMHKKVKLELERHIVLAEQQTKAKKSNKGDKELSEAAADREARSSGQYKDLCTQLAQAEHDVIVTQLGVEAAKNEFKIAMADGQ